MAGTQNEATASQPWDLLEARLWKRAQLTAAEKEVFEWKCNERQKSVAAYDERLSSAWMAMQKPVSDETSKTGSELW